MPHRGSELRGMITREKTIIDEIMGRCMASGFTQAAWDLRQALLLMEGARAAIHLQEAADPERAPSIAEDPR